jgi:arylsulfatase
MAKPFRGVINVDVTQSVPDSEPYTQPIAPEGTPSVLYIVLDDVGYSAMGPYGGLIETPNIDRIAQRGLTYTNFHTTARAAVDVSGAPFVDLAAEARMAFMRD